MCEVEGCQRPIRTKNLCNMHYMRQYRTGFVGPVESTKRPYGSGWICQDGYHMTRHFGKPERTHRIIAAEVLGRPLKTNEIVHHINGNKLDNRKTNLLICTQEYHTALERRIKRFNWKPTEA